MTRMKIKERKEANDQCGDIPGVQGIECGPDENQHQGGSRPDSWGQGDWEEGSTKEWTIRVEDDEGRRGGKGECSRLPPVSDILSANTQGAGTNENVKRVMERKEKKVVDIPTPVMEEMEIKGGEVEVDFEGVCREDAFEIPTQEL